MLHQGEHFLLGLLIIVPLPRKSHPHTSRDVANATTPHKLVQLSVDSDVLRRHRASRELPNVADGTGRALLELAFVQQLVQVDCVIPRDGLLSTARTRKLQEG